MKGCTRGGIRSFEKIKSTINCKLIEESQHDQCKKFSVFKDLQDFFFFFYINIKYYNICYLLLYFNYYATLQGRCQEEQKTMSTPWPTHENTQLNQQLNKHLQNGTHTIRY